MSTSRRGSSPETPIDLSLGLRRARAATLLTLALPGSAYLYQGEELGLPEVVDLPEEVLADPIWERSGHEVRGRDGCRVPIPWTRSGSVAGLRGRPALVAPAAVVERPLGRGATGCRGLDVGALPRRAGAAPQRAGRSATAPCAGVDGPPGALFFERDDAGSRLVCAVNRRRPDRGADWPASDRRRCRSRAAPPTRTGSSLSGHPPSPGCASR